MIRNIAVGLKDGLELIGEWVEDHPYLALTAAGAVSLLITSLIIGSSCG